MAKWWYVTLFRCPDCNTTWEEYDHTGSNYDSGCSGPRVVEERCEECELERCKRVDAENAADEVLD
jgi:hypothetical protein